MALILAGVLSLRSESGPGAATTGATAFPEPLTPGPSAVTLRVGEPSDVDALLELINGYAPRGLLLWRSEVSLRARLGDFVVAARDTEDGHEVVGGGALARLSPHAGEVRVLGRPGSRRRAGGRPPYRRRNADP